MILKGSRYEAARPFAADPRDGRILPGIRPREIGPAEGVLEHVVKAGERLDQLAHHYFNDPRLWWRIVDANPRVTFAGDMTLEALGVLVLSNYLFKALAALLDTGPFYLGVHYLRRYLKLEEGEIAAHR